MILQEKFRTIIKDELSRQGISQSELARRLGVAQPVVNRYLNGKTCPGLDMVEKFFTALGIPLQIGFTSPREPVESVN